MRTILIYSGGLDSTSLLYHLLKQGHQLRCLGVDYGQRHSKELASAERIASLAGVEFRTVDLTSLSPLFTTSALVNRGAEIPEGHYADETMKATVVPNRNMIMLAVAIGWAISTGSDSVAYAAHAGDHTIYPDCRPEFAEALDRAARLADWSPVRILCPFIDKTKADIVRIGVESGAPLELTWSCYKGMERHCGHCGTCVERREAFELAGVPDPTDYFHIESKTGTFNS